MNKPEWVDTTRLEEHFADGRSQQELFLYLALPRGELSAAEPRPYLFLDRSHVFGFPRPDSWEPRDGVLLASIPQGTSFRALQAAVRRTSDTTLRRGTVALKNIVWWLQGAQPEPDLDGYGRALRNTLAREETKGS